MKGKKIEKITIIRLIKTVTFFIGLIVLFALISYTLTPKTNYPEDGILNPNSRGFYGEPENTIDIAVIGNSNAYSGFSPMELWHIYGYTAYLASEGAQNIGESINMLNEILSCQSPKLVVLDVGCLWADKTLVGQVEGNMKSMMYNYLPLYRYHDRWKEFSFDMLFSVRDFSWTSDTKGQKLSRNVKAYEEGSIAPPKDDINDIPPVNLFFLNIFLNICEKNDIEVLLLNIPSVHSWNDEKHDAVEALAREKGLPYIDMNQVEGECAIDWSTDSRDGGKHLNSYGARKVTQYVGTFIHDNYVIEDKRGNATYAEWDACYESYEEYMKK